MSAPPPPPDATAAAAPRVPLAIPRAPRAPGSRSSCSRAACSPASGWRSITLVAVLIQVFIKGVGRLALSFITDLASSIPDSAGIGAALVGTLWLMAVCIAFIVPVGVASAVYLEEYADREPLVQPLHRGEHPEPRRGSLDHLRHPRAGVPGSRATQPGPRGAGRGSHPRAAGPAGSDHRRARGDPRRPALDPRGLDGSRGDQVADDLEAGASRLDARDRHRGDPRASPGRSARRPP